MNDIELFVEDRTKRIVENHKRKQLPLRYLPRFKNVKSRYYESISEGNFLRRLLTEFYLYGKENVKLQKIRNIIALDKGKLTKYGLFYDRIKEFQIISNSNIFVKTEKSYLQEQIEKHDLTNDFGLYKALQDVAPIYFLRKMQLPTLNDIDRFQKVVDKYFSNKHGLNILDYGCGSGDVSIYALKKFHKVTICDVKGANLDYAIKRFELRNLKPIVWESTHENPLPFEIDSQFDIINCLEVLEHLRNPFEFIDKAYDALVDNGVLILGSFPFNPTNDRGDHLTETVNRRAELEEYIYKKFRKTDLEQDNTFIKKNQ